MALTAAKEEFAREVARRTGLQVPTVRAWVAIEGGPDDNPLNIARWDASGRRYFAGYGSTGAAVNATVRLLSTERYAPVLRIARHPQATIRHELWAIIESPWEETHYTLNGVRGARLIGTYARLYPRQPSSATPVSGTPVAIRPRLPSIPTPFPDLWPGDDDKFPGPGDVLPDVGGWFGAVARWIEEKAALAFLYVVLTAAAVGLIALGLLRATGTSPPSVRGLLRRSPDDIPF